MGAFDINQAEMQSSLNSLDAHRLYTDDIETILALGNLFYGWDITSASEILRKYRAGINSAIAHIGKLDDEMTLLEGASPITHQPISSQSVLHPPTVVPPLGQTQTAVASHIVDWHFLHQPSVSTDVELPVVFTLSEDNVGLLDETVLEVRGTVVLTTPTDLRDVDCERLIIEPTAEGSTVLNCRVRNPAGFYGLSLRGVTGSEVMPSLGVGFAFCEFISDNNDEPVLGSGGDFLRCLIRGGEDGVKITSGTGSRFRQCIIDEQNYQTGNHSDAVQITGGGGWVTIEDSILQARWNTSNGPVQLHTNLLTGDVQLRGNYYWGGVFALVGTSNGGNYTVTDNDSFYAWGTFQYGLSAVGTIEGARWYSRQFWPRRSGSGGSYGPVSPLEAPNFPGNLTLVDDNPWEATVT